MSQAVNERGRIELRFVCGWRENTRDFGWIFI